MKKAGDGINMYCHTRGELWINRVSSNWILNPVHWKVLSLIPMYLSLLASNIPGMSNLCMSTGRMKTARKIRGPDSSKQQLIMYLPSRIIMSTHVKAVAFIIFTPPPLWTDFGAALAPQVNFLKFWIHVSLKLGNFFNKIQKSAPC